jgi:hypothetical protein
MEQDHRRAVVQEEVLDEGEEVEVGWEALVPELDLVEVVSAPIAGQGFLTKSEFPAII